MPRVSREQADRNREAIEEASARLFREKGLNGIGVADLMAAVGLTHGGFYGHFSSKDELAAVACAKAFEQTSQYWSDRIDRRKDVGLAFKDIIKSYLSPAAREAPGMGCAAAALANDVAREPMDKPVRAAYIEGVRGMLGTLESLAGKGSAKVRHEQALVQLAAMVGALSIARAAEGDPISDDILAAVRSFLLSTAMSESDQK
jgi:TetR/AcrR family transcriptional repressor of nem operon